MMELQKAIENVTYRNSRKFPAEEFEVILGHKEEATPYLYEALDYALQKADDLDTEYALHLYALYFLAEFHDRNSFKRILKLASMPSDTLDDLFGDVITEDLADIMYSTYDGNLELLKEASKNPQNEEYVCMAMLNVMAQLYLDGTLDREEWKNYLHQFLLVKNLETELYTTAVEIICKCHFVEMLPEIYSLFQNDFINRWFLGDYDECVDLMFEYPEKEIQFCRRQVSVFSLKSWAMFEQEEKKEPKKSNAKKEGKHSQLNKPVQSHKIGRNDPCPCGSGKKYKHCCLNKPKEGLDAIESREERNQKLLNYPEVGAEVEKEEGKVYLENYFDTESIEIDQLVYLAFRCFPASVRNPKKISQDAEMKKKKAYLLEAFTKYTEKLQKEGIHTQEEYDKKFMIHYQSSQWIGNLLGILEEDGDKEKYREVLKYYNS